MKWPLLLILVIVFPLYGSSQSQSPYKIAYYNDIESKPDSMWVLFPDIQSYKKVISFPYSRINSPHKLKKGDLILLDTTFKLEILVTKIKWTDKGERCYIDCKLPSRQNAKLVLRYWKFGEKWVFDGDTLDEPTSCDHLNLRLKDENTVSIGLSYSWNCK